MHLKHLIYKKEIQHWINCWSKLKGPRAESVVNIWKKTLRTYNFMNNEKMNQIVEEAWNSYRQQTMFDSNPKWLEPVSVMDMKTGEKSMGARQYHKNNFLAKCKTDLEFSQKWGLKIEERDLTYTERYKLWFENNYETGLEYDENKIPDFNNQYYKPTSTKLITITYNNETIESYE